jgi:hypothetical protein
MTRMTSNGVHKKPVAKRAELRLDQVERGYVLRLKAGQVITFTCYSPKPWGLVVHWDPAARRTEGHYEPTASCVGCMEELATKEIYYLFGRVIETGKDCFIEMPDGAAKSLVSSLALGESLRGAGLVLQRGKTDNTRLKIRVSNRFEHVEALPKDKDPLPTLEYLWAEDRPLTWQRKRDRRHLHLDETPEA